MMFHAKGFQDSAEIWASPAKEKRERLTQDLLRSSGFRAFYSLSLLLFTF